MRRLIRGVWMLHTPAQILAASRIAEQSALSFMISRRVFVGIIFLAVSTIVAASAGEFDSILRWRNVGPYRGGRTRAVSGVPSQPNVFYMAPVNGGVFKSIDYGRNSIDRRAGSRAIESECCLCRQR